MRERYKNDPIFRSKQIDAHNKWKADNPEKASKSHKIGNTKYRNANKEKELERTRKWKTTIRKDFIAKITQYFPKLICVICGEKDPSSRIGVHFHEINGKHHPIAAKAKFEYILAHHNDFVPICNSHHIKATILMEHGLSWSDVVYVLDKLGTRNKKRIRWSEVVSILQTKAV